MKNTEYPETDILHMRENGNANGDTKFVLSHIGHPVDCIHEELTREAAVYGMIAAYDEMEIEFGSGVV